MTILRSLKEFKLSVSGIISRLSPLIIVFLLLILRLFLTKPMESIKLLTINESIFFSILLLLASVISLPRTFTRIIIENTLIYERIAFVTFHRIAYSEIKRLEFVNLLSFWGIKVVTEKVSYIFALGEFAGSSDMLREIISRISHKDSVFISPELIEEIEE